MNRGIVILLGAGGAALLVLAFFGTRRGSTVTNIGNVGSTIALPFGMNSTLPSLDAIDPSVSAVASAASSAPSVAKYPGAFNRYGLVKDP